MSAERRTHIVPLNTHTRSSLDTSTHAHTVRSQTQPRTTTLVILNIGADTQAQPPSSLAPHAMLDYVKGLPSYRSYEPFI